MESKNRNVGIIVVAILLVACCSLAALVSLGGLFAVRSLNLDSVDLGALSRERLEQSFEVGDAPVLDIQNFAGSVTVRPGDSGAVHVVAAKRAGTQRSLDRIKITVSEQGGGLSIRSRVSPPVSNASVELEITTPADTRLNVDTGAGAVEVRGITGPISVDSGAGQVDLRGARGPVIVDLGAGQIIYEGAPSGDCHFGTGAGEIVLLLPNDLNMEVDLSTGIGAVGVDYRVDGQVKPREVRGIIGDGSQGTISAHTGAGAITLKRQ